MFSGGSNACRRVAGWPRASVRKVLGPVRPGSDAIAKPSDNLLADQVVLVGRDGDGSQDAMIAMTIISSMSVKPCWLAAFP